MATAMQGARWAMGNVVREKRCQSDAPNQPIEKLFRLLVPKFVCPGCAAPTEVLRVGPNRFNVNFIPSLGNSPAPKLASWLDRYPNS